MKRFICAFLLGSTLSSAWSFDQRSEKPLSEDKTSNGTQILEEDSSSLQFSNLVKTTMDLLGPTGKESEYSHSGHSQVMNQ